MKEVTEFISSELSDGEWWGEENEKTFISNARKMIEAGMSAKVVKEILAELYSAIADEFGS